MPTVREFVRQSYRLVDASNPTVPLHGDDQQLGIIILNQLLQSYASTGLMITIARTETVPITIGQQEVVCGPDTFVPTPDITTGRLANLDDAWLILSGVTYPLINKSRDEFLATWRYEPLQGLPRFVIVFPETDVTRIRLYPAPSQGYEFFVRGKFQLNEVTANDTMGALPQYYVRYLQFALAKDIAMYKGRADAWTDKLESILQKAEMDMIASSEVNLSITGDEASLLNGSWRVMAGI